MARDWAVTAVRDPLSDQTAIAGIGWTAFTKDSGTTVVNLAAEASLKAIEDAGLEVGDIDGIVTYWWRPDTIMPRDLAEALGITECHFELFNNVGGSWSCAAVTAAAMAVHAGMCRNVLVYRAMNGRSQEPRGAPQATGKAQYTIPFGLRHDAGNFGHYATAHMARYGTTTLDFAHLAVTQRRHAMLNTKAMMRTPITIEDHQASRWIVYPFRLLDCCLVSDGAGALVVTSAERARDLRHAPVLIHAAAGGGGTMGPWNRWETVGLEASKRLYAKVGVRPADLDFAEIYDPYTAMCMLHMENFGLVEEGGSGAWVRAGENGLDGQTPVNTHGGLLSEAYIQGLGHVIEAVQQLRPEGVVDDLCEGEHTFDRSTCRQVRDAKLGLVVAERGDSSLLLRAG
jgi:acetyl-CoA acetyltransferase